MERVRRNHAWAALQAGQRVVDGEGNGGDREPAPQPDAGKAERRGGDHRDIEIQRPIVGSGGDDQQRSHECAGDAEARQSGAMQQSRGQRAERDQSEQDEGGGRCEKVVQRVARIDRGEGNGGAGGRQDRRNIGDRQWFGQRVRFLAAAPFACAQQRQRKQRAEHDSCGGTDQTLVDGVFDEKKSAESQRQSTDPHHPACAETLFEAGPRRRSRRRRGLGRLARSGVRRGVAGLRCRRSSGLLDFAGLNGCERVIRYRRGRRCGNCSGSGRRRLKRCEFRLHDFQLRERLA